MPHGMKKSTFLNPFAKHDVSEFEGVLVPLPRNEAERRASLTEKEKEKPAGSESDENGEAASIQLGTTATRTMTNHTATRTFTNNTSPDLTIETLRADIDAEENASGTPANAYDRKAKVINRAIQDIGMGKYQWQLFTLCGFGWLADNLWLQGVALTLDGLSESFGVDSNQVRFTTLALFLGLCIGASFWGIASDIVGRRLAFNGTLFLAGVFGIAAGAAPSWYGACALYACVGLGVGGNLPVDGALFLEFIPCASGSLLTLLSVWWPIGQLVSSLLAWAFFTNFPLQDAWRYFVYTLGAITFAMFLARFFLFHLFESPKFLLARGRQHEAVTVVHGIAYFNGVNTWLTEDILDQIGGSSEAVENKSSLSTMELVKRNLSKFSGERFKPLFASRKLAITTVLLWWCWTTIGMGYPLFNAFLPQYIRNSGGETSLAPSVTYRNYAITSIVGVPGSFLACWTVDLKYVGRKGTMWIATFIAGIFVFLFTVSADSNFQLAFSSLEAFFQNIMYGVLYAYTPEVFPAPNRGTGSGVSSFLNRVAGLCAPIVAVYAGEANPKAPIYASGGLLIAAGVAMVLLPIETRGKQTL